jgi:hypothetical protein
MAIASSSSSEASGPGAAGDLAAALVELRSAAAACLAARGGPGAAQASTSELLKIATRLAAAGLAAESGEPQVVDLDAPLTPTEVALVSSRLLKEVDLELFELAMWRNWGKA